jgi:hypothetical protein
MDDSEKVDLLDKMAYATRMVEYSHTTRRGCSKSKLKDQDRAVGRVLEILLGRKPTIEEVRKVCGDL